MQTVAVRLDEICYCYKQIKEARDEKDEKIVTLLTRGDTTNTPQRK